VCFGAARALNREIPPAILAQADGRSRGRQISIPASVGRPWTARPHRAFFELSAARHFAAQRTGLAFLEVVLPDDPPGAGSLSAVASAQNQMMVRLEPCAVCSWSYWRRAAQPPCWLLTASRVKSLCQPPDASSSWFRPATAFRCWSSETTTASSRATRSGDGSTLRARTKSRS
jgi:hypothetical protein